MGKFYDIAFHVLNDRVLVKKNVYSEKDAFDAWQDACVGMDEKNLRLFVDDQYITLDRAFIVRVDVRNVEDPVEKDMKRNEVVNEIKKKVTDWGL
ncbi:MAG: hypothetical protein LBV67_01385 [Streptococcaceae bacterium]|nr:hypothetical protein [Streptococcaceae bacterium]